ncbi:MAG: hypothetical protein GAK28_02417 [Luteibacter sp.]|uniref:hypothetical protein n=1 Tax=Luteibacter sp. TaxID=1886636 RepID=UPI00137E5021|nr:hypothetical protein [Luteibacter sp.]KAF1006741.1 MAG: hypothetical protein GAK28_02417 [Luteibacter sp.]
MTTDKTSQNELYGYSLDGETFHGRYATRAEALAEGIKAAIEDERDTVTTGRHDAPPHTSEFMPDIDDILEHMAQKASDDYDGEDWPDVGKDDVMEARQQLEAALDAFANAVHAVSPPCFHYVVDEQTHDVPGASA